MFWEPSSRSISMTGLNKYKTRNSHAAVCYFEAEGFQRKANSAASSLDLHSNSSLEHLTQCVRPPSGRGVGILGSPASFLADARRSSRRPRPFRGFALRPVWHRTPKQATGSSATRTMTWAAVLDRIR